MSCDAFEELLPLYVGGELGTEERKRIDEPLAACASCRESIAFYRELETSLVSRGNLRPSSAQAAAAVTARLGFRTRRRPIDAYVGVPALASAGFILLGIVLFAFRGAVARLLAEAAGRTVGLPGPEFSNDVSRAVEGWTRDVGQIAGLGNEWVLLSVYAGFLALVLLTGSWMVLKFVRE
jgi:anti-sigma factor RsiW